MAEKKTEKKDKKFFSKKNIKIAVIVIAVIAFVGIVFALDNKDLSIKKEPGVTKVGKEKVKVVKNEANTIQYDTYDNGLVSFEYPKGWKVEIAPSDYIHYSFKVTNPDNPDYMILFSLKLEGFLKSEKAKSTWKYYYPSSPIGNFPVIEPKTTEAFYKVWNETAAIVNNDVKISDYYPTISEFNVIENLGEQQIIGGDVLRVNYKDMSGNLVQGLVTASVMDIGSYSVTENWNIFSNKVDIWPMNVYNIVLLTAPDEEFVNWQPILDHTIATLEFSDTFMSGFNSEESAIVNTVKANAKIYNEISDMIMDSWEKRSNSYDIISQKQSDATLGYERVYDTQTGDVYKADSGFMDNDWNGRYESVTDDMYNQPISGYIEKVD